MSSSIHRLDTFEAFTNTGECVILTRMCRVELCRKNDAVHYIRSEPWLETLDGRQVDELGPQQYLLVDRRIVLTSKEPIAV